MERSPRVLETELFLPGGLRRAVLAERVDNQVCCLAKVVHHRPDKALGVACKGVFDDLVMLVIDVAIRPTGCVITRQPR